MLDTTNDLVQAGPATAEPTAERSAHGGLGALVLGAIGVVYGDIGTSPLYTMREAFGHAGGLHLSEPAVLGVLSLVFWSLMLIVTLKYVVLILRADNKGEGGVLALSSLAHRSAGPTAKRHAVILVLAIAGLALFYGDGLITPAISVLSAVEGLSTANRALEPWVLPIAVGVLVLLFVIQRHGTGRVGALFGPIMVLWFATLGLLGLAQIVRSPDILRALDPRWAVGLFEIAGFHAFVALGAIVLAVTGAEALYADMGHFGRTPIRVAWLGFVLPALLLNYFGQGVLVLRDPTALEHPFFHLASEWALWPLIGLATLATIIASQAVISGVFSLTRQAIQLGYLPRSAVRHTSESEMGQVYLPAVNWMLMAGVLLLVLAFGSSSNLAAAYGISVTGAMGIDAVLAGCVAAWLWGWPVWLAGTVFGALLLGDIAYFAANALKIPQGGWLPLVVAGVIAGVILIWRRGRRVLHDRLNKDALPLELFLARVNGHPLRVSGTAVFMTGNPEVVPHALLHNLKHNKVLHERLIVMTVRTEDVPTVPDARQVEVERLGKGCFVVTAHFGFAEQPNVLHALELCRGHGLAVDMMSTSFFLGRETLIASKRTGLGPVAEQVFIMMSVHAQNATAYFCLPPERVVELGTQVEI